MWQQVNKLMHNAMHIGYPAMNSGYQEILGNSGDYCILGISCSYDFSTTVLCINLKLICYITFQTDWK